MLVLFSTHTNAPLWWKISCSEWRKHTVMKPMAGVADFLSLTERKYGCWELCRLANYCHTTSRHRQNYQRKTNGGIDSLLFIYSPLWRRNKFPCWSFVSPSYDTTGCMRWDSEQATHAQSQKTHTQTPYICINLRRVSSQMPLNVAEGENHARKEAASE